MNKIILCGRLVRDPEVRYSQGEKPMAIASFTLAVDRKFKQEGQPTADFISCKAFGKVGETVERYVHQGNKIIVEGRWQTGNYTNKDGVKVYTNDCMVENIEFCESKNSQQSNNQPAPAPSGDMDFMKIDADLDEGLPFS